MGIIDLLTGLFAVKQLVKLWPEMAKDLISVFFRNETLFFPISLHI